MLTSTCGAANTELEPERHRVRAERQRKRDERVVAYGVAAAEAMGDGLGSPPIGDAVGLTVGTVTGDGGATGVGAAPIVP